MLFRKSSNVSARLRRSKSSSSVRTVQASPVKSETLDPEVARQHALAAASLAFERANQPTGGNNLTRQKSTSSSLGGYQQGLSRRQSVRFAGSTAVNQRQLARTTEWNGNTSERASSPASMAVSRVTHKYQPYNHVSGTDRIGQAAAYQDELYTPQDNIASAPSSYRRVRKSKSMFDPSKVSGDYGSRTLETSHNTASKEKGVSRKQYLRAPKSSFSLRGHRSRVPREIKQSHDDAVQLAREMFLGQSDKRDLDGRTSHVGTTPSRRHQAPFRRTFRSSSDTEYGGAVSSSIQQPRSAKERFATKARNITTSVRSRFKRVFHRSTDQADNLPAQQLEASRQYYGDHGISASFRHEGYHGILSPDTQVLSTVTSRVPSVSVMPSGIEPRSRNGSVHSGQSDGDLFYGKSRVTSWTNSTAANTLATGNIAAMKRLSIINENGDQHQDFFSGTHNDIVSARYAAFRGPREDDSMSSYLSDPVSSHQIYSALIRKLDEGGPEAEPAEDATQWRSNSRIRLDSCYIPPRSSSMDNRQKDAMTKQITEHAFSEHPLPAHSSQYNVNSFFELGERPNGNPIQLVRNLSKTAEEVKRSQESRLDEAALDSANERSPLKRLEQEPQPIMCSPPVGLVLTPPCLTKHEIATGANSEGMLGTDRELAPIVPVGAQAVSAHLIPMQGSTARSGSVYSRSTSGDTPKPFQSTSSIYQSEHSDQDGLADYLSLTEYQAPNVTPTSRQASASTKSSSEWKMQMASTFSGLDPARLQLNKLPDPFLPTVRGHRREGAHIVEEAKRSESESALWQPPAVPRGPPAFPPSLLIQRSSNQTLPLRELSQVNSNIRDSYQRQGRSTASLHAEETDDVSLPKGTENEQLGRLSLRPQKLDRLRHATSLLSLPSADEKSNTPSVPHDGRNVCKSQTLDIAGDLTPSMGLRLRSIPNIGGRSSPERAKRLTAYRMNRPGQSYKANQDGRNLALGWEQEDRLYTEMHRPTTKKTNSDGNTSRYSGMVVEHLEGHSPDAAFHMDNETGAFL